MTRAHTAGGALYPPGKSNLIYIHGNCYFPLLMRAQLKFSSLCHLRIG
ncbi:unnamed protein product [Callosobruchus maculatus]|uniref:Uncharacterized protein n=1 Tax=Callosobruchus maculatus TaxID=64391 RepID=A0A653D738_CALMS|nr:unnamed protein product [Callosobruchus maculatus]